MKYFLIICVAVIIWVIIPKTYVVNSDEKCLGVNIELDLSTEKGQEENICFGLVVQQDFVDILENQIEKTSTSISLE